MRTASKVALALVSVGLAHLFALLPFLWLEAAQRETITWFQQGPGIGYGLPYAVETFLFFFAGSLTFVISEEAA